MTDQTYTQVRHGLSPAAAEATLHLCVAVVTVIASVSAFAISTTFGVAATFAMTLLVAIALPAGVPLLVATAFLFQNTVVAWYAPLIPDNDAFDALRGSNFVLLMTAFGAFFAAAFQARMRAVEPLRPWIVGGVLLCGVVVVYLGSGHGCRRA